MSNPVMMTFEVDADTHMVGWDGKSPLAMITKKDLDEMIARITELETTLDLYRDSKSLVEANDSLAKRIAELEAVIAIYANRQNEPRQIDDGYLCDV